MINQPCRLSTGNTARAKPVTADELSKATRAEKGLVTRYMRVLIAEGIVIETGLETYAPGRTAVGYTLPGLKDAVIHA